MPVTIGEPPRPELHAGPVEFVRRVLVVERDAGRSSLPCPRCHVALFEGVAGSVRLHGCGVCGGIWLDTRVASALLESGAQHVVVELSDRAARAATTSPALPAHALCPVDGAPMKHTTVHGVAIDACEAHGTWFDAAEVRRVAVARNAERLESAAAEIAAAQGPEGGRADDRGRYLQGTLSLLRNLFAARP